MAGSWEHADQSHPSLEGREADSLLRRNKTFLLVMPARPVVGNLSGAS